MKNSTQQHLSLSAKTYANALVDVVKDKHLTYEEINNDFETVRNILNMSLELNGILINPTITSDIKIELVNEIFQKDVSETMLNFIKILIDKKRFKEFSQIHCAYKDKLNEIHNIQPVTIISAVELSENDKIMVIKKLEHKLNKTVYPDWQLDDDLIAGLVIKINDNIIDMSIKNRLSKLKKDLTLR